VSANFKAVVGKAVRWRVPFTIHEIQQYSNMTRQFLTSLMDAVTTKPPYKTPARLAVEQAIRWRVPFTVMDIQQHADIDELGARRFLSTLVGRGVLVCIDGIYSAASAAETWLKTPPRSRPGGNDQAYKLRKEVLDRWRKIAWEQGRRVEEDPGISRKTRATPKATPIKSATDHKLMSYSIEETAVFFGCTSRCIRYKIKAGDIKVISVGGARRIAHNEITRILEGRRA